MAVAAGRQALAAVPADAPAPDSLWFATAAPAYLDKTNATAVHAALRLDRGCRTADLGGARSGSAALLTALDGSGSAVVAMADLRSGPPASAAEVDGGDGGCAFVIGDAGESEMLAVLLGSGSTTDEFLERWRLPAESHSAVWEERFAESVYPGLVEPAWNAALKDAGVDAGDVDRVVIAGSHARTLKRLPKVLGIDAERVVDARVAAIGNPVCAAAGLGLVDALEGAAVGDLIAVVNAVDGADVLVFRVGGASDRVAATTVDAQAQGGHEIDYATFLTWRGELTPEPPNRPEPARASAPPAFRQRDWKFGFVGSRDRSSEALHLPPARVSFAGGAVDEMDQAPMADVPATVVTFTIDRLSYSLSPPIVFAVIDFDGGGRLACELTDVDADTVRIGDRVEMTFRRLMTSDGIHNYFWKARPLASAAAGEQS